MAAHCWYARSSSRTVDVPVVATGMAYSLSGGTFVDELDAASLAHVHGVSDAIGDPLPCGEGLGQGVAVVLGCQHACIFRRRCAF